MTAATDIPTTLGADNQGYIRRAFTGYITPPREVIAYVQAVLHLVSTDSDGVVNFGGKDILVGGVTYTAAQGEAFKKIKIVEAADMIRHDLARTCQDSYIGKYANSYDNKCLLISAIKGYFESLELEGILDKGKSAVTLDVAVQSAYLKGQGVDTSKLNEQQLREANTGDKVFIACTIKILDAIEDISIGVVI